MSMILIPSKKTLDIMIEQQHDVNNIQLKNSSKMKIIRPKSLEWM